VDDYGQPLAAISMGERPQQLVDEYLEYLATPGVRNRCQNCEKHHTLTGTCTLLDQPIQTANGIYCLPIKRGTQEYGVLNLFVPIESGLSQESQDYLQAVADQTALAIEAVRLRKKELDALSNIQGEWKKTDTRALLNGLLEHIHEVMNADFSRLQYDSENEKPPTLQLTLGEFPNDTEAFLNGVIDGVIQSGKSVVLGEVQDVDHEHKLPFSLIVTPLGGNKIPVNGTILVGSYSNRKYTARQRNLLSTISGQVSLVLENYQLIAELESKTMLEERTRLAREIHDGLAQNLGFLRLQLAQIKNIYDKKEYQRMKEFIDLSYSAVSEAYEDVREAIDGLRIDIADGNFVYWIEQVVNDFVQLSDIEAQIIVSPDLPELPKEIQVQLIRILQESLSNIRKHSEAKQVDVRCLQENGYLSIEIDDDGLGFIPSEVYGISRHGLVGMQERTRLIGAIFDIESQPDHGTSVKIRLPLSVLEASV
jgi:two-component system nitrate/nitrite sensor histidine kinase NarX